MLVITRRVNEAVVLSRGSEIIGTIRVVHIDHGKIRLAFDLPRSIQIDREEAQVQTLPADADAGLLRTEIR